MDDLIKDLHDFKSELLKNVQEIVDKAPCTMANYEMNVNILVTDIMMSVDNLKNFIINKIEEAKWCQTASPEQRGDKFVQILYEEYDSIVRLYNKKPSNKFNLSMVDLVILLPDPCVINTISDKFKLFKDEVGDIKLSDKAITQVKKLYEILQSSIVEKYGVYEFKKPDNIDYTELLSIFI